ncbi:hypothetical protein TW95_gp0689 [Pandoravirus inopinatum]|uniref:Swiss Army Knife RNA repair protein HAD domain-containing protein n=1 Tax=Pandoravirus inopinatum TaxID=1605721 RepID=A0A0B5IXE0_9VIRU|nr:hypothetical protein TW95_gp0689 [Pandoravirus inopinatum]AJF97423.1 hypothetical protein [Pandoravirus inopinatum]
MILTLALPPSPMPPCVRVCAVRLKPPSGPSTIDYKTDFIGALIAKHMPRQVNLWDDRVEQIKGFGAFLETHKRSSGIVFEVPALSCMWVTVYKKDGRRCSLCTCAPRPVHALSYRFIASRFHRCFCLKTTRRNC